MSTLADLIVSLNGKQKEAVFHGSGPCVVNAVPGSGKTRCLTTRFAKLINDGVPSYQILCSTFTKKAAVELKERLLLMLGNSFVRSPYVGTMHSVFNKMLMDHPDFVGTTSVPVLSRAFSVNKYIKEIAKDFGDKYENIDPSALRQKISLAKNNLLSPEDMEKQVFKDSGELTDPAGLGCFNSWD